MSVNDLETKFNEARLWKNPEAKERVMIGLQQAEARQFSVSPPDLDEAACTSSVTNRAVHKHIRLDGERSSMSDGSCTLAGKPGRGDCLHFVGLPDISIIPKQHDGLSTEDEYGKPNGWCWSCWKSWQIEQLIDELKGHTDEELEHPLKKVLIVDNPAKALTRLLKHADLVISTDGQVMIDKTGQLPNLPLTKHGMKCLWSATNVGDVEDRTEPAVQTESAVWTRSWRPSVEKALRCLSGDLDYNNFGRAKRILKNLLTLEAESEARREYRGADDHHCDAELELDDEKVKGVNPETLKECSNCGGSGSVMTRDTGICGTEEYGPCRTCRGKGRCSSDHRPCHCLTCVGRPKQGIY